MMDAPAWERDEALQLGCNPTLCPVQRSGPYEFMDGSF